MKKIIMVSINGTMYFFYSNKICENNIIKLKQYASSIDNNLESFSNDDEICMFYQKNIKNLFNINLRKVLISDIIRINKTCN